MSLINELWKDRWKFKREGTKEPVKVLMHPEVLTEILDTPENALTRELMWGKINKQTIFGIPLGVTDRVRKWSFETMTDMQFVMNFIDKMYPTGEMMLIVWDKEIADAGPFLTTKARIHTFYDPTLPWKSMYLITMEEFRAVMDRRDSFMREMEKSIRLMTDK